mmetsp:Transcript_3046/g.7608  ORF Transcript_3046/g.7608 Transcript_3046/m.7608 type:complete len:284 (-) Transcript_3046:586-1437(-)
MGLLAAAAAGACGRAGVACNDPKPDPSLPAGIRSPCADMASASLPPLPSARMRASLMACSCASVVTCTMSMCDRVGASAFTSISATSKGGGSQVGRCGPRGSPPNTDTHCGSACTRVMGPFPTTRPCGPHRLNANRPRMHTAMSRQPAPRPIMMWGSRFLPQLNTEQSEPNEVPLALMMVPPGMGTSEPHMPQLSLTSNTTNDPSCSAPIASHVGGMLPCRLFSSSLSSMRFNNKDQTDGSPPESELLARLRYFRADSLYQLLGRGPSNIFLEASRNCSLGGS